MTSDRICTNSMRSRGTAASTLPRISSMTSNDVRVAVALRLSAERRYRRVFCSVANRPSSAPVRRDVPVISGVEARMFSRMCSWRSVSARAVPPGAPVVEHERALVDLREEARSARSAER